MKIKSTDKSKFTLVLVSKDAKEFVIKKQNVITEDVANKVAYFYVEKEYCPKGAKAVVAAIVAAKREYQIDVKTFVNSKTTEAEFISALVECDEFTNGTIYNAKTAKKEKHIEHTLINVSAEGKKAFEKAEVFAKAQTYTRDLQVTPPNLLNSESYAKRVVADLKAYKNLSVKVLNKKQIEELKMGLFLSVNKGSAYEPRVVVIEYTGDKSSKDKTAFVGKGITFDAGGLNIKTGKYMEGMKFDMSGSAAVAGAMTVVAQLKPKANVVGLLMLTDNMISPVASTPDTVWTAMNGKTVEINNTDAEGRLALADGLTYAAKNLKATRLIDVATLTGAVLVALGHTYTGVWTTTEKAWEDLDKAAKKADELVWRLPLHDDFFKYMKGSKVADMFNTDMTGMGGSSSAAMFLTQFTEGKEYIHLDIAGTADVNGVAKAPMVKTLFEVINNGN